ncbi:hypothetical protein [Nocardia thailandica]
MSDLLWYAAYGAHLDTGLFDRCLTGGRCPISGKLYPGFRDRTPPRATATMMVHGCLFFAHDVHGDPASSDGGGQAFFDPDLHRLITSRYSLGTAMVRYLITGSQLSDLIATEMGRRPGADIDLDHARTDRRSQHGHGRVETLISLGTLAGFPIITLTGPFTAHTTTFTAPSRHQVAVIATGLASSHEWPAHEIYTYLAGLPGIATLWQPAELTQVIAHAIATTRPTGIRG